MWECPDDAELCVMPMLLKESVELSLVNLKFTTLFPGVCEHSQQFISVIVF